MMKQVRDFLLSWLYPSVLEKEQRRLEMTVAVREHWKTHGSIHLYELIREDWDDTKDVENTKATKASEHPNYIVFVDKDMEIDWITQENLPADRSKAVSYAESIGAKECKFLPKEKQLEIQRLIGQAIVCAIDGNIEESKQTADAALKSLQERTVEQSRWWSLCWAHILSLVSFILFCYWRQYGAIPMVGWSIFGGIVGAYLFIVLKAGKGKWKATAGQRVHIIEVFSKISSGGVLGAVLFAITQTPLCPKMFEGFPQTIYLFFLLGTLAGFFERFVPRILSSYGDTTTGKGENESKSNSD